MPKSGSKTNKPASNFILILSIVIIVLITVFVTFNKNVIKKEFETKKDRTSTQEGLNVEPVKIKVINASRTWQDSSNYANFNLQKAYLTPTLIENYTQYGSAIEAGKDILVLQVNIRDVRKTGGPREIKFQDYFRLRENGLDLTAHGYLYNWYPQENKTTYVIFPVEKGTEKFTLMLGPFTNPALFNLDFTNAETTMGVINGFDGGFTPEYNPNSKTIGIY